MSALADIARVNVVLELFSECAGAADLDTLLQIALRRLPWVIDSDRCLVALARDEKRIYWVATHAHETPRAARGDLPQMEATLVDRVFESGAPAQLPPKMVCVPVQVVRRTIGAICLTTETGVYSYRDLQLAHHVAQYLGSLISRLDLEEETRRLSRRKDDLLALLSHELRNPLAPIMTAVHLLKVRADGQPSKELDVIERQAQHLVRLVDDLLDVARLTRGKVALQRTPVEIGQIVALAVEMVSPLLEQRRHSLKIDVPAAGMVVDADENRLAQVLSNLLSNAAHYTKTGGHIEIAARRDSENVAIEVSDDGIGIPADALSEIFDLFVQGPDRDSGKGGLGLGLVVVKQLTELHGGSVSVASRGNGRGTTFTIRLPFLPAGAGSVALSASRTSGQSPLTTTPRRVLLVDDNEDALDVLSSLLEREGHQVIVAHDGPAALAVLDQFHPSVAVLDIGLPVMDGYELAATIRAHHAGEQPYLVALTGYGQATDYERSRVAGFNEHLVKPVDVAQLLRVIGCAQVQPTALGGADQ